MRILPIEKSDHHASSIVYIRNAKPKRHKQIASPSRACLSGRVGAPRPQASRQALKPNMPFPLTLSAQVYRLAPLARGTESGLRGGAQRATKLPSLHCRPYSSHPHHRLTSSYNCRFVTSEQIYRIQILLRTRTPTASVCQPWFPATIRMRRMAAAPCARAAVSA